MTNPESRHKPIGSGSDPFETTQWSVVIAAGKDSSPEARQALATLCQKYWGPLYIFVRRKNYTVEDAQDITQGFFAQFLERGSIRGASRDRGKFRAYLLSALKHYMTDEWRKGQAQKRGGGQVLLSLDFDSAEKIYNMEPVDNKTPDVIYQEHWAMTLLNTIFDDLEKEYGDAGRADFFSKLKPYFTGEDAEGTYAQLAEALDTTEGAIKTSIYRLRKRFGSLLRAEIAQTVANADDVEDEINHLFSLFQ